MIKNRKIIPIPVISRDDDQRNNINNNPPNILHHQESISEKDEEEEEEEEEEVNKFQFLFLFLIEPTLSKWSKYYHIYLSFCVLLHVLIRIFESMDGPNHYSSSSSINSSYPYLGTQMEYNIVNMIAWIPMSIDAILKILLLILIYFDDNDDELFERFIEDKFDLTLYIFDIISVIPFLFSSILTIFSISSLLSTTTTSTTIQFIFKSLELFSSSKILRITKDYPNILAIRITLIRSFPYLILPIFFYFVFNIFFGVIIYFLEPCYQYDICPWSNLFESSFFSIVTMTSTGYGNQVPSFLSTRFISSIIMLFGSIFLSMPLAIIGNEYCDVWIRLKEQDDEDIIEDILHQLSQESPTTTSLPPSSSSSKLNPKKFLRGQSLADTDGIKKSELLTHYSKLSPLFKNVSCLKEVLLMLKLSFELNPTKLNPEIILQFCEIKSWISSLLWQLQHGIDLLQLEIKNISKTKRLSIFQSDDNFLSSPIDTSSNRSRQSSTVESFQQKFKEISTESNQQQQEQQQQQQQTTTTATTTTATTSTNLRGNRSSHISTNIPFQSNSNQTSSNDILDDSIRYPEGTIEYPKHRHTRHIAAATTTATTTSTTSTPTPTLPCTSSSNNLNNNQHQQQQNNSNEFTINFEYAIKYPNSIRSRIWLFLELPNSSKFARFYQIFSIFLILFSILILFTQSLPSFSSYSESNILCENIVKIYCSDKFNNTLDPGCYVHTTSTSNITNGHTSTTTTITNMKLQYFCKKSSCYGSIFNYGHPESNVTCNPSRYGTTRPFQTQLLLDKHYQFQQYQSTYYQYNQFYDICNRLECQYNHQQILDGNLYWGPIELIINMFFTLELIFRLFSTRKILLFFINKFIIIDIISLLPFYYECYLSIVGTTSTSSSSGSMESDTDHHTSAGSFILMKNIDYRLISSLPNQNNIFIFFKVLKIFRLFKISRHFQQSKILIHTAQQSWKHILAIFGLFSVIIIIFAFFIYISERGTSCYYDSSTSTSTSSGPCQLSPEIIENFPLVNGQHIWVINHQLSQFSNMLESLWFCIVTITTTGYGDLIPKSNLGQFLSLILMFFGSCLLTFPLTFITKIFWTIHEIYRFDEEISQKLLLKNKNQINQQYLQHLSMFQLQLNKIQQQLNQYLHDIANPSSASTPSTSTPSTSSTSASTPSSSSSTSVNPNQMGKDLYQRGYHIFQELLNLLIKHDRDIRRLTINYSNLRHQNNS